MSAPKSVVKYDLKNGIVFTSQVDRANYFIYELTRAALRDVARFVLKKYRAEYYRVFEKHSGRGPKAISYIVFSGKKTIYPRVEIGIKHSSKGHPVKGFYTYFHEVGTIKETRRAILKQIVEANISEIRQIEAAYLSAVEDELKAQSLIESEEDYRGDGETDV